MSIWQTIIDELFDCSFIQQFGYFIEDGIYYRETTIYCRRCGGIDIICRVAIREDEFWDQSTSIIGYDKEQATY